MRIKPGLHDIKVGDYISIGLQGFRRGRVYSEVVKITEDTVTDYDKNVFLKNGILKKIGPGYSYLKHIRDGLNKKPIISAKPLSKKELEKEAQKDLTESIISKIKENKLNCYQLREILDEIGKRTKISYGPYITERLIKRVRF